MANNSFSSTPGELDEFLRGGMAEANDTLGVEFLVSGQIVKGVPAPLEIDDTLEQGGNSHKLAWSITVPLPLSPDAFPKGTKLVDNRGRNYKVVRAQEFRMSLHIIVTDLNR